VDCKISDDRRQVITACIQSPKVGQLTILSTTFIVAVDVEKVAREVAAQWCCCRYCQHLRGAFVRALNAAADTYRRRVTSWLMMSLVAAAVSPRSD